MLEKIKNITNSNIFGLSAYFAGYLLIVYSVFLAIIPEIKIEKLIFLVSILPLIYINSKFIELFLKSKKLISTKINKKNIAYYIVTILLISIFLFVHDGDIFIKLTILFFSIALILSINYRIMFLIGTNIALGTQITLMMQNYQLANTFSTYMYYFLGMGLTIFFIQNLFGKNQNDTENENIEMEEPKIWEDSIYTDISIFGFTFFVVFMFLLKDLKFETNGFWSISMMILFITSGLFLFQKLDVKKMLKNQILKYIFIALLIPYIYFSIGFISLFWR